MTAADADRDLVRQAQALLARGQPGQALQALQPALSPSPALPSALKLLLRLALQHQAMPLAAQALRTGMALTPRDPELHALAAAGAKLMGQATGLERSARQALALDPAQPLAAALLAEHLGDRLQISEGLQVADRCLHTHPREWGVLLARANLRMFAGDADGSVSDADTAVAGGHSLQALQAAANGQLYLDNVTASAVMQRQQALARRIPGLSLPPLPAPTPTGDRPLRVGLLSPDLRRHPVGELIEPLLRGYPRERMQLVGYQDGAGDAFTARLRSHGSDWRETAGLPDEALAQLIREDRLDVLLDLAGHTAGSRPRLLASRVAPRQLGYLGFLFDTGLDTCDGVIGDRWNLPTGKASARNPLRLPDGFLCYPPPTGAPEVELPGNGDEVVFGSFNHLAKLSPDTLALWARVLQEVPRARLRLCALALADGGVRERLAARFAAFDLDPKRIELLPPLFEAHAFLKQYGDIDIALDPLPFGGGMTTLQALWQGVPVLTLPGERMAARSGASILAAAGLHDCVAGGPDAFVRLACRWANDADMRRQRRKEQRTRLRDSRLTDAAGFCSGFADVLERACANA